MSIVKLLYMLIMTYGIFFQSFFRFIDVPQKYTYSIIQHYYHFLNNYLFVKLIMLYTMSNLTQFNLTKFNAILLCFVYVVNSINIDVKIYEKFNRFIMIIFCFICHVYMLMYSYDVFNQSICVYTIMSFMCSTVITFYTHLIQKQQIINQDSFLFKKKYSYRMSMIIRIWEKICSLMIVRVIVVYLAYQCAEQLNKQLNTYIYIILFVANISVLFIYIILCGLYTVYSSHCKSLYIHRLIFQNKRIYCCGVFDIMHEGHLKLFKNMSKYGDVIVGVLDDNTVKSYKRTPIMTHTERCDVVKNAKYVKNIIPNCPMYTNSAFIKKHNIDIVAISEEYFIPPFKYYEDCVRENKYVIMPRHTGICTSDLIKRIKSRKDLIV